MICLPTEQESGAEGETPEVIRALTRHLLEGGTPEEASERLLISERRIRRFARRMDRKWKSWFRATPDFQTARELAKLTHLESSSWRAWERSQEDGQIRKVSNRTTDNVAERKAETTSRQQFGKPEYLKTIGWCIHMRCKLMALIPIGKLAQYDNPADDLTHEELTAYAKRLGVTFTHRSGSEVLNEIGAEMDAEAEAARLK